MKISKVCAAEVLDSRGFPTVQAYVKLESGIVASASVPSGASTGAHEALELRDGDAKRFMGKGVTKAVANVNDKINSALAGKSFDSFKAVDACMLELDGCGVYFMKISKVCAAEVLDSRGFPTVQAYVKLESGIVASASVPSGASTGAHEALELRDGDAKRFMGKGVTKAVANVNDKINSALAGKSFDSFKAVDACMLELDGTKAKTVLGANAVLAVSLASARAMALENNTALVNVLGTGKAMPVPFMNILNGGAHAKNNIDIQEFMIVPMGASTAAERIRWCSEIYHCLGKLLAENSLSTAVGDEGGFAPNLPSDEETLNYLSKAVEKAGYKLGSDIFFAIDAAASEWVEGDAYHLPKSGKKLTHQELVA